jgi:transcriptional regulator with XRE-family HTH domain
MAKITNNLRAVRRARGMTLKDLERQTKRTDSHWSRVELDERVINILDLADAADVLQTHPLHLFEFEGWPLCPCHDEAKRNQ